MATELAKAYVQIIPSAEGISGSLSNVLGGEATAAGKAAGGKFSSAMGGVLKTGAAAIAGIGTAAIGAGTALTGAAAGVASYGDHIDKMSQKMGLTAEAYQEWDAVMQHSGTSMDTMKSSMKTLANAAETNNKAFKELGITENDLKNMNQQQIFEATIAGLQNVEDDTQRTYLAGKLLGKGATELGALLNTSAEDTQAMRDRVHELGGVMSDEAVKNSAAFQDSLQDLQTSFTGVKNSVMSEMLPSFTSVMDGLASLVVGEEGAKEKITAGTQGIVSNITEAMPQLVSGFSTLAEALLKVAPELISALAQGILSAIPELLPTLVTVVGEIGTQLIGLLPQLAEVGLSVISELALGIASALPDLIPTIVDCVLSITQTLIDNADLLIDGAIALILGLAEGLISASPQLIERIPEIVESISSTLVANAPKLGLAAVELILALGNSMIETLPQLVALLPQILDAIVNGLLAGISEITTVGKDMVEGLWRGIEGQWIELVANVRSLGKKLVDSVKGFFKIGSPSKLFADEVGQWIPEGLAVGIEANTDSVDEAVDDMVKSAMVNPDYNLIAQQASTMMPTTSGVVSANNSDSVALLTEYLPMLLTAIQNSRVVLEGDAKQMFRMVRNENNEYRKANGVSALA